MAMQATAVVLGATPSLRIDRGSEILPRFRPRFLPAVRMFRFHKNLTIQRWDGRHAGLFLVENGIPKVSG